MTRPFWEFTTGAGPLVATAIHAGHDLRPDIAERLALSESDRLREEDPYTDRWITYAPQQVRVWRSRFETDLNRARAAAIYREPDDAWGLHLWHEPLPAALIEQSLREYDAFYTRFHELLTELEQRYGRFVVYDIHSYNHRRAGPDAAPEDSDWNPEINVGTGALDRRYWAPVVDRFIAELRAADCGGRRLDVRENVRFTGGHLSRYVARHFPHSGCTLAIEVKKFFMDEWTGVPDEAVIAHIGAALAATVPAVLATLETVR